MPLKIALYLLCCNIRLCKNCFSRMTVHSSGSLGQTPCIEIPNSFRPWYIPSLSGFTYPNLGVVTPLTNFLREDTIPCYMYLLLRPGNCLKLPVETRDLAQTPCWDFISSIAVASALKSFHQQRTWVSQLRHKVFLWSPDNILWLFNHII